MRTTSGSRRFRWRALAAMSIVMLVSGCSSATPGSTTPTAIARASHAVDASTPTPAATPQATPAATTEPTPAATTHPSPSSRGAPPPPSSATMKTSHGAPGDHGIPDRRFEVHWTEKYPKGTEIRVYGVTECLNNVDGEPCLVPHTPLPASVRHLVAKARAADGKAAWTWPGWENIGGALASSGEGEHDYYYEAFVAAAYNDAGHSKFIILDSAIACPGCTY
jgi:hypothetical protein